MGLFSKKGSAPKNSFFESEVSASGAAEAWKREYGHINFLNPSLKRFAPEKKSLRQKLFGGAAQPSTAPAALPPATPQGPHDQFIDAVAHEAPEFAPIMPASVKRTAHSDEMITRVVDHLKADGDLSMKQDTIQRLRTLTYRAAVDTLHSHPDLTWLLQNKPQEFFALPLYRNVSETYLKETAERAFGERASEFLQNIETSGRFTPKNLAHIASSRTIFTWLADEKDALVNANPQLLRKKAALDSERMRKIGRKINEEFSSDHGVGTSIHDSALPDNEKQTRPMPVPEDMHHHAASTPPAPSALAPQAPAAPAPAPAFHETTAWVDTVPPAAEQPAFVAHPAHKVFHDSTPWEDTIPSHAEPAVAPELPAAAAPAPASASAITPEPAAAPAAVEPLASRVPPAAVDNLPVLNEVVAEPAAAPTAPALHVDTPAAPAPAIAPEPAATPAAPVAAEAPPPAKITKPAPQPPIMPSPAPEPVLIEPPALPIVPPAAPALAPIEPPAAPAAAAPIPAPAPVEPAVPAAATPAAPTAPAEPHVAAPTPAIEKIEAAEAAIISHKPNWLNRVGNPKLAAGAAGAVGAVGLGVWAWKEFVAKPDPNALQQHHTK